MGVGLVAAVVGILGDHTDHHQRTWANLLVNGFFFLGISLGALFFFALQNATETGWTVLVKRIFEGIMSFVPVGAIVMIVVLAAGSAHVHHLYHWMDHTLYHPYMVGEGAAAEYVDEAVQGAVANPNYDHLIAGKKAFLNQPFFWLRSLLYIAVFVLFGRWFRQQSLQMDKETGDTLVKRHLLNYRRSALFLVFFAVFSSTLAWDWLMSIDTHWFSTLYGWYAFSGMWVSAMVTAVILALYLKRKGLLPQVSNSHIHDMGKWVFAISFLWSYLYFSQFMLIWYSNIPEEVTYFQQRIDHHPMLLWGTFFINFAIPMVMLMSRDAKRNPRFLIGVGSVIFVGHWLDVNMMVMPGALGHDFHGIGLLEAGMFLAFLGVFIHTVLTALTKAPLTPVNHPYLDESVHHQI
ncbi:MAG: quinol:cytochrome C oxidoreductase [Flavobacteriales bacterium]|nr:quinol:cytochrome C oxidoreductase [Flavobacteriales bacterium]MBK9514499.1 quinol:cytochrome C oxidoreductase [Flavobacteriales bacterium]